MNILKRISKNYIGIKFGEWTVIERCLPKRPIKYLCLCKCGKKQSNFLTNLTSGNSIQCQSCADISRSKEMIGKKYNKYTVLNIEKINNKTKAKVKCDCGNIRYIRPHGIKKGYNKCCGKCKSIKIGDKFGLLSIIKEIKKGHWEAFCDCGKVIDVKIYHLKTQMPCCGCYWKNIKNKNAEKLIGYKQHYITVIKFLGMKGPQKQTRALYLLKCKCGNKIEREISHLFYTQSCGCLHKEKAPKGSKNYMAKTNENEVLAIRELFTSGLYTRKEISEMVNLKYENICNIIRKSSWKHI